MAKRTIYWWGRPYNANRWHVFEGEGQLCKSLCGYWGYSYNEGRDEVDRDEDSFREGEDCKKCSRKVGLIE